MKKHWIVLIGLAVTSVGCDKVGKPPETIIAEACMTNANSSTYGCNCLVQNVAKDEALKIALARALKQCAGQDKATCNQATQRELGPNGSIQVGMAAKGCGVTI